MLVLPQDLIVFVCIFSWCLPFSTQYVLCQYLLTQDLIVFVCIFSWCLPFSTQYGLFQYYLKP